MFVEIAEIKTSQSFAAIIGDMVIAMQDDGGDVPR